MHLTLVVGGVFRNDPAVLRRALSEFEKIVTNERVHVYIRAYDLDRASSQIGSLNSYPIMTSAQFLESTCFNVEQLHAAQRSPEVQSFQTAHRERQASPPPAAHSATSAARSHPQIEAPARPQGSQVEQFQAPPAATAWAPVATSFAAPDACASSCSERHQHTGASSQQQQMVEESESGVMRQTAHAELKQPAPSAASQPQLSAPNRLTYKETVFWLTYY